MATMTATALAQELDTTAREVRKFLRSVTPKDDQPGKGSQWAIEKRALRTLRKQYREWDEARQEKAQEAAPEEKPLDEAPAEGPTAEDLAQIEDEDLALDD